MTTTSLSVIDKIQSGEYSPKGKPPSKRKYGCLGETDLQHCYDYKLISKEAYLSGMKIIDSNNGAFNEARKAHKAATRECLAQFKHDLISEKGLDIDDILVQVMYDTAWDKRHTNPIGLMSVVEGFDREIKNSEFNINAEAADMTGKQFVSWLQDSDDIFVDGIPVVAISYDHDKALELELHGIVKRTSIDACVARHDIAYSDLCTLLVTLKGVGTFDEDVTIRVNHVLLGKLVDQKTFKLPYADNGYITIFKKVKL